MKRAVIHGSAMASFCVEKFGPERLLNLTHEEVEAREAQFADLVRVVPASPWPTWQSRKVYLFSLDRYGEGDGGIEERDAEGRGERMGRRVGRERSTRGFVAGGRVWAAADSTPG